MNSFQNLSKRIRKRIQNSVKRLFTSKSSFDENNLPKIFINGSTAGDKRQSSIGSSKSYSSCDQDPDGKIKKLNQKGVILSKSNRQCVPVQSGEEVSIKELRNVDNIKHSSSKSNEIKSNITKTTSRSHSDKSKKYYDCPTGRHSNVKTDEPCICINTEQLLYHQSNDIIYEWHKFKSEPTSLDSFKLEYPNTCIQGGQGVVFWVYDTKNSRHFALKMKLRENKSNSSWLIERRESKMLKKIQHNFIVNLYHVYETPGAMFMTMEYLDGGCLWSHIAKKGTLPESYTVYYSACILNALYHLHQKNIVYRDLKAENIVLDAYGRPKLIDFGMAKQITQINCFNAQRNIDEEAEHYPATQYYYAAYLAPEIYSRPSSANIYIDSWGLGYVVSEILLGYGVFVSMPWEKINTNQKDCWKFNFDDNIKISNHCQSFLESMLRFNPNSRMSLDDALHHQFFRQIHWSSLVYIKPPDLTVFRRRTKGSGIIQAIPNDISNVSTIFEFCDLQLPDPLLTPSFNNQCNANYVDVASPKDTPINPNAPSIRLPILVKKENYNYIKYNGLSNNFKYDIYRAFNLHSAQKKKFDVDTVSNLRPIRR